jgi:hypothetical protein
MQPIRQGDVILLPTQTLEGQLLPHLTLAEGEVTGHKHRISDGQAELYENRRNTLSASAFRDGNVDTRRT